MWAIFAGMGPEGTQLLVEADFLRYSFNRSAMEGTLRPTQSRSIFPRIENRADTHADFAAPNAADLSTPQIFEEFAALCLGYRPA